MLSSTKAQMVLLETNDGKCRCMRPIKLGSKSAVSDKKGLSGQPEVFKTETGLGTKQQPFDHRDQTARFNVP